MKNFHENLNRIEKTRQQLLAEGCSIIQLSSGNPTEFGLHFPPDLLEKAFQNFHQNPLYEPDPKGDHMAREAIVAWYRSPLNLHQIDAVTFQPAQQLSWINSERILLTSGTSESYFHLFKYLAEPGDEILFPRPSYPLFAEIGRLADIKISFYQLEESKGWQIDTEDLEHRINDRTKAIVLISPSNPTGAVLHIDTLQKILEIAHRHHLPIISDEVFSEFMFDKKTFPRIAAIAAQMFELSEKKHSGPTIFTLSGVSKTFALPGLKLGWIIVSGENAFESVEALERSIDTFLATSQVAQSMLPTILAEGKPFLHTFQQQLERNRNLATSILRSCPQLKFHQPEGGFYLFLKVDLPQNSKKSRPSNLAPSPRTPTMTDEDLVIKLMEKTGIFVHPGYFYDYDKEIYLLISLLSTNLEKNLKKLVNFLAEKIF